MVNGGFLMKCALVAVVLVAVVESGSAAQKLATCCTTVNKQEITEPILDFMTQKPNAPCVPAVIFQTKSGLYCSYHKAPWVRRKIVELINAKALSTLQPKVSLLSIITSTASSPSSSTSSPSSSTSPPSSSTSLPSSSASPPSSSTYVLSSSTSLPSSSASLPSSSASPPPSSVLPSFSSSSEMPADETFARGGRK